MGVQGEWMVTLTWYTLFWAQEVVGDRDTVGDTERTFGLQGAQRGQWGRVRRHPDSVQRAGRREDRTVSPPPAANGSLWPG